MDVIPYTKRLLAQSMVGSVQLNDVVLSHQCFSLLSSSLSKNQVTILKSIYSCLLGKIRIFNGGISSTDLPETPFFLCILRNLIIPSSPFLKIYYGNVKHTEVETSITNSQESITQFREPTFYFIISWTCARTAQADLLRTHFNFHLSPFLLPPFFLLHIQNSSLANLPSFHKYSTLAVHKLKSLQEPYFTHLWAE